MYWYVLVIIVELVLLEELSEELKSLCFNWLIPLFFSLMAQIPLLHQTHIIRIYSRKTNQMCLLHYHLKQGPLPDHPLLHQVIICLCELWGFFSSPFVSLILLCIVWGKLELEWHYIIYYRDVMFYGIKFLPTFLNWTFSLSNKNKMLKFWQHSFFAYISLFYCSWLSILLLVFQFRYWLFSHAAPFYAFTEEWFQSAHRSVWSAPQRPLVNESMPTVLLK